MHWLKSLFVRTLREQEFERELQFHIEEVTRDFLASGMTPEEAHRRAMLWNSAARSRPRNRCAMFM